MTAARDEAPKKAPAKVLDKSKPPAVKSPAARALMSALIGVKKTVKAEQEATRKLQQEQALRRRSPERPKRTSRGRGKEGSPRRGRDRGERTRKGEPLPGKVDEDPEEVARRDKRNARFGIEAKNKDAATAEVAAKPPATVEDAKQRSRPRGRDRPAKRDSPVEASTKTNAEERSEKPEVVRGMRGWSDDEAEK